MKVIAFNGSPRKEWNTATLLRHALQGAAAQGAETELIHLYDLFIPDAQVVSPASAKAAPVMRAAPCRMA